MSLKDRLKAVAQEHPERASDLLPLLKMATRLPCCRNASVAQEKPLRKAIIRAAHNDPSLRPLLLPLIATRS